MCVPHVPTLEVFRRLAGGDLPASDELTSASCPRQLGPGEPLFQAGERTPFAFVVNQGVIKLVYETSEGDAWIKGFVKAGVCFASLTSLMTGGVASFSAYAVVDTHVDQIAFGTLERLADRHLGWQRALSNAYKLYGQRKEQREMELLTCSPEERYLSFLCEHPELVSCLRQRDIASYIRVTPVALSRIRSRLKAQRRLA
ncbi:Crp/Fnr family transcriptional regulator [Hydrogenophaga sp. A37]|uniref:Crp/Fnr family transcriptional regulator n=1 Tax=Hydrogenophaga sp. A37 TaxID=1945864 RepID=UPI000985FF65|nr:Crp/Fnr family transcriptional regulator [Hydrogenophaga sp. A37]OOG82422.1 cyclic nucleotide-binding protein [Hydrogenophaga sp. A37]